MLCWNSLLAEMNVVCVFKPKIVFTVHSGEFVVYCVNVLLSFRVVFLNINTNSKHIVDFKLYVFISHKSSLCEVCPAKGLVVSST